MPLEMTANDPLDQRRALIGTMILAVVISLASSVLLHPTDTLWSTTIAALRGEFTFIDVVLIGTYITHVWSLDPQARQRSLLMCLVLEGGSQLLGGSTLGVFAGFLAIGERAYGASQASTRDERRRHLAILVDGLAFPVFALTSPSLLGTVACLRADTFDAYLARIDNSFPVIPSVLCAQIYARFPHLETVSSFAYGALAPLFCVIYAESSRVAPNAPPTPLRAWMLAAILGCLVYLLFPIVGPAQFFGGLPFPPNVLPEISDAPTAVFPALSLPRNGTPSLHTTWSLLAMMHARPLRLPFRIFGVALFLLTELATLGLGEHWLVDLIVAWPFAVGVDVLVRPGLRASRRALLAGIAGLSVTLWLLVARYFHGALAHSYVALLVLATLTAGLAFAIDQAARVAEHQGNPST